MLKLKEDNQAYLVHSNTSITDKQVFLNVIKLCTNMSKRKFEGQQLYGSEDLFLLAQYLWIISKELGDLAIKLGVAEVDNR